MPEKNRKLNRKFLAGMIFFLVFLGLFVFGNNNAKADESTEKKGDCQVGNVGKWTNVTNKQCQQLCKENKLPASDCEFDNSKLSFTQGSGKVNTGEPVSCGPLSLHICLLQAVLGFVKLLMVAAATFFKWVVDPENMRFVLQNSVIYTSWTFVRDILNVAFILVLLFSAFCTIFQVEKYNYKKILLTLVIMALLVNFSYPITRFIIDVSNVAMYDLANLFFQSNFDTIFTKATGSTTLNNVLNASYPDAWAMIAGIVFIFILAVTFFALAILLWVRIVALAILIIFSSVAFIANIFPGMSSYASKWWDNLFKYAFFGPIMLFIFHIAVEIMSSIQQSRFSNMKVISMGVTQNIDPNFLASVAFFAIPIVILWMGMAVAQSMSIAGAGAVMGKAQKFMKGTGKFAMKGFGIPKATGLTGGLKKFGEDFKKTGKMFGVKPLKYLGFSGSEAREGRERAVSSFVSGGVSGYRDAKLEEERKKVQEKRDEWKKLGGADVDDLEKILDDKKSSLIEKRAAALEMAEKTGFGNATASDAQKLANYQKAMASLAGDAVNLRNFNDKTKEKNIKLIIDNEISTGKTPAAAYSDNLKGMTAEQLAKQKGLLSNTDFILNFLSGKAAADPQFVEEVAKKMSQNDRATWKRHSFI